MEINFLKKLHLLYYLIPWGGDELVMLLPNTEEKEAEIVLENIISACKDKSYKLFSLSTSLGISTIT